MTDLSKIKFVGISLQAAYLFSWLSDYAGGKPKVDETGRWVIEVKPQHAPTLAQFAALRPGRNGTTSDRSVRRWLAELVAAGMVEPIRTRIGNGYLLVIPEAAVDARLTRQAAKIAAAGGDAAGVQAASSDRTEVSSGQDHTVRQIGHHRPTDRTPVSSRCHDRLVRQDTPTHKTPLPAGHSFQEPGDPPDAREGGGGGGGRVGDPGRAAVRAMIELADADTYPVAKAAFGRLAGQDLTEPEFAEVKAVAAVSIERIHRASTGDRSDPAKIASLLARWVSELGIGVNDPQAAVDALRRVGVSERQVETLTRSKPPQAIVEAVRAVETNPAIRNPAGAVVSSLTRSGGARMSQVAV